MGIPFFEFEILMVFFFLDKILMIHCFFEIEILKIIFSFEIEILMIFFLNRLPQQFGFNC